MGMPSVSISFSEKARSVVQRGERGTIAMIVKDTTESLITHIPGKTMPNVSDANKKQIELACMGYVNLPKKLIIKTITDAEGYENALEELETEKFDYLVCPTCETDEKTEYIATWVKARNANGQDIVAILPNSPSDSENIVNFVNTKITVGEKEYTAEEYCSRIAGIIAGTPLTMSCTYAPLLEVDNCDRYNDTTMDEMVDAGKLFVFWDGEKVKLARAINSFKTTTADKGEQFKKIKLVDTMKLIKGDIKRTAQDSYLGKYANTYDNKQLLVAAIGGYLGQLKRDGIISDYDVSIDLEESAKYLEGKGYDVGNMSEQEIKMANTGAKVFIAGKINIPDAMEDIKINFTI